MSGVRTVNLPTAVAADSLLGNRDGATVRVSLDALATQLLDETPLGDAITAGTIVQATWADLLTKSPAVDGTGGEVLDSDAGTHSQATATGYDGATVNNAGRYAWNEAWGRWVRIGDTGLTGKADAALRERANHTGTQAIATVEGLQDALDDRRAVSPQDRPGETPEAFSAVVAGEGDEKVPFTAADVVLVAGAGRCLAVSGAGVVALRHPVALGSDVWEFTARVRRTQNPSDPNNHAVQLRAAWLDGNKAGVGVTTLATLSNLLTGSGATEMAARVCALDVGGVVVPPDGAVYVVPYVQTYGGDGATAVEILRAKEVTDLHGIVGADFSSLIAAMEAEADSILKASWAELDAITGTRDGQRGVVTGPDAGTHTDPVVGGTVANIGTYSWDATEGGWRWLSSTVEQILAEFADIAVPVDTATFKVADEEGFKVIETDAERGVGIGGVWLDALLTGLLRVRDEEGWRYLGLDPELGFELPYCWLRPTEQALLRIMDDEGFVFFQVAGDGATTFVGGGSAGVATPGTVEQLMVGRVTPTGADILADIAGTQYSTAALVVATDPGLLNRVYESPAVMPAATARSVADGDLYRTARFRATDLQPGTLHHYAIMVDGVIGATGTFRTFPAEDEAVAFSFATGSCSRTEYGPIMETLEALAANPEDDLFLVHLGDITYADIDANDIYRARAELIRGFRGHASGAKVTRTHPMMIAKDDHDSLGPPDKVWESVMGDGSDHEDAIATELQVYRETALPYPFPQVVEGETDPDKVVLAQEWNVGRVGFIMPDSITQRTLVEPATSLGTGSNPPGSWNQKQWLKDRLAAAGAEGRELVFLFMTPTWVTSSVPGSYGFWFLDEREELANFIRDTEGVPSVVLVAGDLHRSLIDDGVATDYSTGGGLGMAHVTASAFWSGSNISYGNECEWLGTPSVYTTGTKFYTRFNILASGGRITGWECRFYGEPFGEDYEPTLLGTYSTADAEREIAFTAPSMAVASEETVEITVARSFVGIGPSSATWTTSDAQSGTVQFRPNQRLATISVEAPAAGSITVTLSDPEGLNTVLGSQATITLTVA